MDLNFSFASKIFFCTFIATKISYAGALLTTTHRVNAPCSAAYAMSAMIGSPNNIIVHTLYGSSYFFRIASCSMLSRFRSSFIIFILQFIIYCFVPNTGIVGVKRIQTTSPKRAAKRTDLSPRIHELNLP